MPDLKDVQKELQFAYLFHQELFSMAGSLSLSLHVGCHA